MILIKLVYKKDIIYFFILYKLHSIVKYINSNYAKTFKNQKSTINYYFFINRTIII